jgi:hypothetical protein
VVAVITALASTVLTDMVSMAEVTATLSAPDRS